MLERLTQPENLNIQDLNAEAEARPAETFDVMTDVTEQDWENIEALIRETANYVEGGMLALAATLEAHTLAPGRVQPTEQDWEDATYRIRTCKERGNNIGLLEITHSIYQVAPEKVPALPKEDWRRIHESLNHDYLSRDLDFMKGAVMLKELGHPYPIRPPVWEKMFTQLKNMREMIVDEFAEAVEYVQILDPQRYTVSDEDREALHADLDELRGIGALSLAQELLQVRLIDPEHFHVSAEDWNLLRKELHRTQEDRETGAFLQLASIMKQLADLEATREAAQETPPVPEERRF